MQFNNKIKGSSPQKFIRGNLHVMIVYDFDSDAILAELINNVQAVTIRDASLKMNKIYKTKRKTILNYTLCMMSVLAT